MPDFTVTITDPDALDAMNAIIAANGSTQTPEQYLSDFCTLRHYEMREGQLVNVAQAKAQTDPALVAFRDKKTAKIATDAAVAANADPIK